VILVVSGTNRPGSNTLKVARQALGFHRQADPSSALLDLAGLPEGLLAPGAYERKPAAFAPMEAAFLAADGVAMVVPEYHGSLPGALKLFLDMLPSPESFEGRPFCFVGLSAGESGGVRPVEHLQQVLGYCKAHLYPERVFLPRVHKLLGGDGLLAAPEMVERLRRQATGFADFVRRLRAR
jgi:NAD(P)H-dependent FMN reductase